MAARTWPWAWRDATSGEESPYYVTGQKHRHPEQQPQSFLPVFFHHGLKELLPASALWTLPCRSVRRISMAPQ